MPRRGLNCTLSYSKVSGESPAYRVRARRVTAGFDVLAEESQGRTTRAMYPRKHTSPSDFSLTIELTGPVERNSFNAFLMRYAQYVLDSANDSTTFATMTVDIPRRNFKREGVPKQGFEFGARLGEMVWRPRIVFETSREPNDWDATFATSIVQGDLAASTDPATNYFYPTGVQLYGSQAAAVQASITGNPPPSPTLEEALGEIFDGVF